MCVHGRDRQLSRCGLIRLVCQTLEYCWRPNVDVCLIESLRRLITDNKEYVAVLDFLANFSVRCRYACSFTLLRFGSSVEAEVLLSSNKLTGGLDELVWEFGFWSVIMLFSTMQLCRVETWCANAVCDMVDARIFCLNELIVNK